MKLGTWSSSNPFVVGVLGLAVVLTVLAPGTSAALQGNHKLIVQVVHASQTGTHVHPKLKKLSEQLRPLKFTSLKLRDEAVLKLPVGSAGRMQLPGGEWMTVLPTNLSDAGKLRLVIEVKKLAFKTTVVVDAGATVVARGPAFEDGILVLSVTRQKI